MALFARKKTPTAPDSSGLAATRGAGAAGVHVVGPVTVPLTARQCFELAEPLAGGQGHEPRLILVRSGTDLDPDGVAGTWLFDFVYPDDRAEGNVTVHVGSHPDHPQQIVVAGGRSPWPAPGSPEEAMLLYQGPTARIIVEQQWADRLERLPGLPGRFVDSTAAMRELRQQGAAWLDEQGLSPTLKGRTLPGGQAVWELALASGVYRTSFV